MNDFQKWIRHQFRKIWCKIKQIEENGGGGTTPPHNNLTGLQGGQEGEYYHLTQEEYENLGNSTIGDVSATERGVVNNTSLQELGGVDKTVHGVRVGKGASSNGTSNAYSTAVGKDALKSNTTGANNTAVGDSVLVLNTSGSQNTGVGASVLESNTTGIYNSGLGCWTLPYNTTGSKNTAVGVSLYWNSTGQRNTGIGFNAGYGGTTGSENTYIGNQSGYNNGVGSYNTSVGSKTLITNGTGTSASTLNMNRNVFIGVNITASDDTNDTLAIDNKGATPTTAANSLLYGGFAVANRFLNIGGKLSVTPSYMPNADVTYTKNLVYNPTTGVFAIEDKTSGGTSVSSIKQRFTGDTVSTKTLTYTPLSNSVDVILNGVVLDEQGGDYTVSGTTLTLASAPLATDVIIIKYLY